MISDTSIQDIINHVKKIKAEGKDIKRIKHNFAYIPGLGYITGAYAINQIIKATNNGQ